MQMDGGSPKKVEAATRRGQNGNEKRNKTIEVYLAEFVALEYKGKDHEKILRQVRYLLWHRTQIG